MNECSCFMQTATMTSSRHLDANVVCLQCDANELKNLRVVDVIDGGVLLVVHLPTNQTHVLKVGHAHFNEVPHSPHSRFGFVCRSYTRAAPLLPQT